MILFGKDISRRAFLRALAFGAGAALVRLDAADAKKKKKKKGKAAVMSRLRGDLQAMAGAPTGSYVIKNTRAVTDNFTLEYDDGSFHTVATDEYDVAPFTGYVVKRSKDDDGNDVDWGSILAYPFYWSGTVVSPTSGAGTVTREAVTFYQENNPAPMIDGEGRINLELAYDAFLNFLIAAGANVVIDGRVITLDADGSTYFRWSGVGDQNAVFISATAGPSSDSAQITANGGALKQQGVITLTAQATDNPVNMQIVGDDAAGGYVTINMDIVAPLGLALSDGSPPVISDGYGIDLGGKIIRIQTSKTPASAADTGNTGEICWDASYIYVCTASNTWKRVALATW